MSNAERLGLVVKPEDVRTYNRLIEDLDRALESLAAIRPSRERSLVQTKIDEALLWAGLLAERKAEAAFAAQLAGVGK